jgi:hypothetical protein
MLANDAELDAILTGDVAQRGTQSLPRGTATPRTWNRTGYERHHSVAGARIARRREGTVVGTRRRIGRGSDTAL